MEVEGRSAGVSIIPLGVIGSGCGRWGAEELWMLFYGFLLVVGFVMWLCAFCDVYILVW